MMRWEKKGKILDHNTFNLSWFKKNAMMALPYILDDNTLRVFMTMCDENNVGRIGYVDLDINNPSSIKDFSKEPLIDIGEAGIFDDNGVVSGSLFEEDGKLYLFYSGYQLCKKIPYMIFTGLAVSYDKGLHFEKLTKEVPLLDRVVSEKYFRSAPHLIKEGKLYRMWYLADGHEDNCWVSDETGKVQPVFTEKYLESDNILRWEGPGENSLEFISGEEHGLSVGSVWVEEGIYKCIYSIRSLDKGYRIGYAESEDGKKFVRKDDEINLDVSADGFDSEMICYPKLIKVREKTFIFYSGNHYGMGGIGYAELVD